MYYLILRGDNMKNSILYDYILSDINSSCDNNCINCPNNKLCNSIETIINSIGDLYEKDNN